MIEYPETKQQEVNTVIIGAGPAGLAVGACLKRAGAPFVILERAAQVGSAWRKHYERLHLHTDKRNSGLPYWPMPKDYPRYPSQLQFIAYLEAYAKQFALRPEFGQEVKSARHQNGFWETQTQEKLYRSVNLVVATGQTRVPHQPMWSGQDEFTGPVIHSSTYTNGQSFAGQEVLVVGFGNSACEIAIDLHEWGARASLAVRSPVNVIPREIFGIPILAQAIILDKLPPVVADALSTPLIRLFVGDITKLGLRKQAYGPMTQVKKDGRIPLIDVGTLKLIRQGHLTIYPGLERFNNNMIIFTDGRRQEFAAIVLATGYRPRLNDFLQLPASVIDSKGNPIVSGGKTAISGLYFCGFYISPTGMLREIGLEARRIAADIKQS